MQDINGTLHFNGVLEEDKGNYTCVATNSQGQINHTINIDVISESRKKSFREEDISERILSLRVDLTTFVAGEICI